MFLCFSTCTLILHSPGVGTLLDDIGTPGPRMRAPRSYRNNCDLHLYHSCPPDPAPHLWVMHSTKGQTVNTGVKKRQLRGRQRPTMNGGLPHSGLLSGSNLDLIWVDYGSYLNVDLTCRLGLVPTSVLAVTVADLFLRSGTVLL